MEAPPQFPGAPKKSKTGLILGGLALAVVLCCCGCGGFMLYFGKGALKGSFGMIGCSVGMTQQREALLTYAEKHGGKLPPAATWQDSIKPYVTSQKEEEALGEKVKFADPSDDFCDRSSETSIAYNGAIAGKKLAEVEDKMGTVALFEVPGRGRNKTAKWSEQPFATSPKIIAEEGRGWIRIPLKGEASVMDKRGRIKPIPGNTANMNFGD